MSLSKSELHRVVNCAIRFVTAYGVGICLQQTAQAGPSDATSNLFTNAQVKIGKQSFDPDIEEDYLPHALQAQENAAGFNINPEALKALAVADRSLLYYSLKAKGEIGSGGVAPVYDPSLPFVRASDQAVDETEREILQIGAQPIIGYAVDGARPTGGTPFGVANLSLDPDPASTEQYVTYNQGKSGSHVEISPLGPKSNCLNRGALSIQGADFLADHGWNYLDILHFYYGSDAQLTLGTSFYPGTALDGLSNYTPTFTTTTVPKKSLANFEHDAGDLQSIGAKNASDQFVNFNNNATDAMRSTKTSHGGRASELLNIGYDNSKAHGAAFTYRILSGASGGAGTGTGNINLPAYGQIGFYLETKTPGLTTHLAVNDLDGTEKSSNHKIIADGKWHKYVWDVNSNWNSLIAGQTDGVITGPFSLNSIFLNGTSNASLRIDDLFYAEVHNNSGGGVPEDGSGGTFSLGGAGLQLGGVTTIDSGTLLTGGDGAVTITHLGGNTTGGLLNFGGLSGVTTGSIGTLNFTGLTQVGAGTLTLVPNNLVMTTGSISLGKMGSISIDGNSSNAAVSLATATGSVDLNDGSITLGKAVAITTITGGMTDYPLAAGTDITSLANGAILLSAGSFGQGGVLLLNSGSLVLNNASLAPQFAELNPSSAIAGSVLVPEPITTGMVMLSTISFLSRRRLKMRK